MTLWRKEAFERLPEFRKDLQEEKSPYGFLNVLRDRLEYAYRNRDAYRCEDL
tara:strand:+ start:2340 stop:2495 length:156 start_codon:yes stop_codon:yes gene_type:complete